MLETLDSYLVKRYLADLRRELVIQGLDKKRMTEVVAEAQVHIEDAMEVAQPQSVADIERVLVQFGDVKAMAKNLSSEYTRQASARPYFWPAAFLVVALFFFRTVSWNFTLFRHSRHSIGPDGLQIFGKTLFPTGIWSGSLFLLASAVTLFVLGYRARRPVAGQFVVATVALTLISVGWNALTSYPAASFQDTNYQEKWLYPVNRAEYDKSLQELSARVLDFQGMESVLLLGQQKFSSVTSLADVPTQFKYGSLYLLPEAVREHSLGIAYDDMWPGIMTSSLQEAVSAWGRQRTQGHAESESSRILEDIPMEISVANKEIAYLRWIHDQPISVQVWDDFLIAKETIWPVCIMATFITLGGWLAWAIVTRFGRAVRRRRYRGDAVQRA